MKKSLSYTEHAYSTFTEEQSKVIDGLIGKYGTSRAEVVRSITICWLENKSLLSNNKKKSWSQK